MGAVKQAMFDVAETLEKVDDLTAMFERHNLKDDRDKLSFLFEGFVFGLEGDFDYPDNPLIEALFKIAYATKHENFMAWLESIRFDND